MGIARRRRIVLRDRTVTHVEDEDLDDADGREARHVEEQLRAGRLEAGPGHVHVRPIDDRIRSNGDPLLVAVVVGGDDARRAPGAAAIDRLVHLDREGVGRVGAETGVVEVAVSVRDDNAVTKGVGGTWRRRDRPRGPGPAAVIRRREAREEPVCEAHRVPDLYERLVRGRVVADDDVRAERRDRRLALRRLDEGAEAREHLRVVQGRVVHLGVAAAQLHLRHDRLAGHHPGIVAEGIGGHDAGRLGQQVVLFRFDGELDAVLQNDSTAVNVWIVFRADDVHGTRDRECDHAADGE